MIGREKESMAALQRLRGERDDIAEEANDIREKTEAFQQLSNARITDLFQQRYAYLLIVGVGVMVLPQLMEANATAYYATEIFESAGFSVSVGSKSLAVIQITFAILGVFPIDKSGRRTLLLVSVAGMGLSYCLIGTSFLLQARVIISSAPPDSNPEESSEGVSEVAADVSTEALVQSKKKEKENNVVRYRARSRGVKSVPKAILNRKKGTNYWLWIAPAVVVALILLALGYFYAI